MQAQKNRFPRDKDYYVMELGTTTLGKIYFVWYYIKFYVLNEIYFILYIFILRC